MNTLRTTLLIATALAATAVTVCAQQRPMMPAASNDPATAASGLYTLDARHASVIARIGHGGGISLSVFRFDTVSGTLDWNGAKPDAAKVAIKVDPKSITSNVAGFAAELAGEKWLNTTKFAESTFTSTAIKRTGPTTGFITGNLTLMGVTKPISVDATLVGAGKGMRGNSAIGFSGSARFKRSDFGLATMIGPIADEVELVIDLEFMGPPPAPKS
jgi:polyisoprenoid-binding protein YceI